MPLTKYTPVYCQKWLGLDTLGQSRSCAKSAAEFVASLRACEAAGPTGYRSCIDGFAVLSGDAGASFDLQQYHHYCKEHRATASPEQNVLASVSASHRGVARTGVQTCSGERAWSSILAHLCAELSQRAGSNHGRFLAVLVGDDFPPLQCHQLAGHSPSHDVLQVMVLVGGATNFTQQFMNKIIGVIEGYTDMPVLTYSLPICGTMRSQNPLTRFLALYDRGLLDCFLHDEGYEVGPGAAESTSPDTMCSSSSPERQRLEPRQPTQSPARTARAHGVGLQRSASSGPRSVDVEDTWKARCRVQDCIDKRGAAMLHAKMRELHGNDFAIKRRKRLSDKNARKKAKKERRTREKELGLYTAVLVAEGGPHHAKHKVAKEKKKRRYDAHRCREMFF